VACCRDFGTSYTYRHPVLRHDLAARLWVFLSPLALYALGASTLIAFPAIYARRGARAKAGDVVSWEHAV